MQDSTCRTGIVCLVTFRFVFKKINKTSPALTFSECPEADEAEVGVIEHVR